MGVASSAPSPLLLIRQAGAGLQLLGHFGKQVVALLSRTQNHQKHAGVERRLGILAGSLVQVAHPVEQVCVDELNLAGHIGGQCLGIARLNKLGSLAVHMGNVLELESQVVLRLVQVGVHLETVGCEAAHHVVARGLHHEVTLAREDRLIRHGGHLVAAEHTCGQEHAGVLHSKLRANVGGSEVEEAPHLGIPAIERFIARLGGPLLTLERRDGLLVKLAEQHLREERVRLLTRGKVPGELLLGDHGVVSLSLNLLN